MSFWLPPTERAKPVLLDEELLDSFRNEYWNHVKETLHHVFKKNQSLADEARRKLDDLEAQKGRHTIFYHASPLEIAANLAEAAPAQITPEQKAAYLELQLRWDVEAVRKHLGVAHPEA
jgi:hypothetical protein